jgi:hypothetical protein
MVNANGLWCLVFVFVFPFETSVTSSDLGKAQENTSLGRRMLFLEYEFLYFINATITVYCDLQYIRSNMLGPWGRRSLVMLCGAIVGPDEDDLHRTVRLCFSSCCLPHKKNLWGVQLPDWTPQNCYPLVLAHSSTILSSGWCNDEAQMPKGD